MITYWLVALLIGLLLVDFTSYLRTMHSPYHARWTIPNSLLFTSIIIAIFCIGLAWRYAISSRYFGLNNNEALFDRAQSGSNIDLLSNWLPYVLLLLALCIIAGVIESWRGTNTANKPITEPYLLLETSQPIPPPSKLNAMKQKWLIVRGITLAFSIIIGFAGAAFLLQFSSNNPETTFFPLERIRPTAQPIANAPYDESLQSLEILPEEALPSTAPIPPPTTTTEPQFVAQAAQVEASLIDDAPIEESVPATGGPLSDTPIEEIRAGTDYAHADDVETPSGNLLAGEVNSEGNVQEVGIIAPSYSVIVQAMLGVKGRTEPSTEAGLVDVLAYGKSYRAIGRTLNGSWLQVELDETMKVWIITDAVDGLLFDINGKIVALDELPSITVSQ